MESKSAKTNSHHKTKKTIVTEALQEYIQRRKQQSIIKLFGQVEYNDDYDYKKQRRIE